MAGKGARRDKATARAVLRIDRWLFQARFFRARGGAAEVVEAGHCRVNGHPVKKPGFGVGAGDVLTFAQGGRIRTVRVMGIGERRGPATEAQMLYLDLDPAPETEGAPGTLE